MHQDADFQGALDTSIHLITPFLKLATFIFVPIALGRVGRRCDQSGVRATITGIVWAIFAFSILVLLTDQRRRLGELLNDGSTRFYPTVNSQEILESPGYRGFPDYPEFLDRWRSGWVFALESASLIVGITGGALFLYMLGSFSKLAGCVCASWMAIVTVAFGFGGKLAVWDYDVFYAGTFVGPVSSDLIFPISMHDLECGIAFIGYVSIIVSCFILDVLILPRVPAGFGSRNSGSVASGQVVIGLD